jgi:predicted Zn-dependent protease
MKRKRVIAIIITGLVLFGLGVASGMFYVSTASAAGYAEGSRTFTLPVSSQQLTLTIQPLTPSAQVLAALPQAESKTRATAQRLTGTEGLDSLAQDISAFYRIPCEVAAPLTIPDDCFNFERQQYDTKLLLGWLAKQASPASFRTAGVLDADVFTEGYNYLFGQARLGGSVCVVSTARMGQYVLLRQPEDRWQSIVRHELGHTLGLRHVSDQRSVMKFANSLAEHDVQGTQLTSYDWAQLKKLHPIDWKE